MKKTRKSKIIFIIGFSIPAVAAFIYYFYALYFLGDTWDDAPTVGFILLTATILASLSDKIFDRMPDDVGVMKMRKDVKGLHAVLHSRAPNRYRAVEALGAIGNADDAEMLYYSICKAETVATPLEIEALGKIKADNVVDYLHSLLYSKSAAIRSCAAEALGEIGDKHSVDLLIEALRDPIPRVVGKAAQALGKIGDDRAIESLLAVFDRNPGRDTRARLVDGLNRFGNSTVAKIIQEQQERFQAEERAEKLRQKPPKAYCGLTVDAQRQIKYSGPLMRLKSDSSGMVEIIRRLVEARDPGHLVIVPQMALLIVIASDGTFKGLHFQAAMPANEFNDLVEEAAGMRRMRVTHLEEFDAIDLLF